MVLCTCQLLRISFLLACACVCACMEMQREKKVSCKRNSRRAPSNTEWLEYNSRWTMHMFYGHDNMHRFKFRMWKSARFRLGLKGAQCKRIYLLRFAIAINIVTWSVWMGWALLCLGCLWLCAFLPFSLSLCLFRFFFIFFCASSSFLSCSWRPIPHYPFEMGTGWQIPRSQTEINLPHIRTFIWMHIYRFRRNVLFHLCGNREPRKFPHPTTKLACITATRSSPALHQPVVQHYRTIRYPSDRGYFSIVFIHSCSFDWFSVHCSTICRFSYRLVSHTHTHIHHYGLQIFLLRCVVGAGLLAGWWIRMRGSFAGNSPDTMKNQTDHTARNGLAAAQSRREHITAARKKPL